MYMMVVSLLRLLSAGSDLKKEEEGNAWRKAEISILRSNLQTMWNNLYNPGMRSLVIFLIVTNTHRSCRLSASYYGDKLADGNNHL